MTQPSPADQLRTAADKLRVVATAAETKRPGRWAPGAAGSVISPRKGGVDYVTPHTIPDGPEVAAYIALMGTDVGRATVTLLDAAAALVDAYPELGDDHDREACDDYACDLVAATLAVARQILGEDTP
ncbi:hypothetical protein AB0A76_09110 [Streptomyces exfoliatus]|uniref:Uncharacterized protein n=1 Tax=Streptomyces exfoliatus TaxID=1905 RepID=A0ABV3CUG9_STREX